MFIAPAAVYFAVFMLLPILAVVAFAFTSWSGFDLSNATWVGLDNWRDIGSDDAFRPALLHTLAFVVISTIALNVFGLGLALLINARVRGSEVLRVAVLLPLALSPVVTAVLWNNFLSPYGYVNVAIIQPLGLSDAPFEFLGQPRMSFATLMAAAIWQYSAFNVLLYYAALQNTPRDQMDAASIDGAATWGRFRHVALPFLRPVIAVVVALNLIGGWKIFELVLVLTGGGPDGATEVLGTYLYKQAFQFSAVGYASAIAVVIIVLAMASALLRRRIAGEDVLQ
jgi:raffinose/stachyose/melibiose transport system permease protein